LQEFSKSSLTIAKPHPLLRVCLTTPTSHMQLEGAVIMASKICVEVVVRGYHFHW